MLEQSGERSFGGRSMGEAQVLDKCFKHDLIALGFRHFICCIGQLLLKL